MPRKLDHDQIELIFSEENVSERERRETLSAVCNLLGKGQSADDILSMLKETHPRLAGRLKREDPWRMVRYAAKKGWLKFSPERDTDLAGYLAGVYDWRDDQITVVRSAVLDDVADQAAHKLLQLVRDYYTLGGQETVRIGIAGGRTLRIVAEKFARLLCKPANDLPPKIVFHAMVSAFSEHDFAADPNSFVTYFIQEQVAPHISFHPMPVPSVVETHLWDRLKDFKAIRQAYEAAENLHIIISSGGSWPDEHSTLQSYIKQVSERDLQTLKRLEVVGDMLWQPMTRNGPLEMTADLFDYRTNALVELKALPEIIQQRKVRVVLVLSACGKCGEPKGDLLDAVLRCDPPMVTDVVTDSPNVYDLFRKLGGKDHAAKRTPK